MNTLVPMENIMYPTGSGLYEDDIYFWTARNPATGEETRLMTNYMRDNNTNDRGLPLPPSPHPHNLAAGPGGEHARTTRLSVGGGNYVSFHNAKPGKWELITGFMRGDKVVSELTLTLTVESDLSVTLSAPFGPHLINTDISLPVSIIGGMPPFKYTKHMTTPADPLNYISLSPHESPGRVFAWSHASSDAFTQKLKISVTDADNSTVESNEVILTYTEHAIPEPEPEPGPAPKENIFSRIKEYISSLGDSTLLEAVGGEKYQAYLDELAEKYGHEIIPGGKKVIILLPVGSLFRAGAVETQAAANTVKASITSADYKAIEAGLAAAANSAKKLASFTLAPANIKRFIAGAISVMGIGTFTDFIGEETLQTAGMGVYVLISEKRYDEAELALNEYEELLDKTYSYSHTIGKLNPITSQSFEGYYDSARLQISSYREIIARHRKILPDFPEEGTYLVREVTDGDTVRIVYEGRTYPVRLVGLNTPERGEPYYSYTKRALFNLVWGKTVTVKIDPANPYDNNSRILGVIYYNNVNINLNMIREGYAFYYPLAPNKYVFDSTSTEAQSLAMSEARGIWGKAEKAAAQQEPKPTPEEKNTGIKISSKPSKASITLDGEFTYKLTSETLRNLEPGEHTLLIELEGYNAITRTVTVIENVMREEHFDLESI